jgi:hypothetical protein
MNNREWVLKRNCSLSPRQLAFAYAALCLTSFLVAAMFAFRGMWYVLAFATLEMASTALAFIIYARHATDQEHIALTAGSLLDACRPAMQRPGFDQPGGARRQGRSRSFCHGREKAEGGARTAAGAEKRVFHTIGFLIIVHGRTPDVVHHV